MKRLPRTRLFGGCAKRPLQMDSHCWHGCFGKVELSSEAYSTPRMINMASWSQIRAGTHHFVFFKYLFPMALQSSRKDELFAMEEGSGGAGGWRASHGCSPDTWRPPAHSGPQSCSHQLPGICHCHFTSTPHCSGNCMCKAELLAAHSDKGASW